MRRTPLLILVALLLVPAALAHVGYVTTPEEMAANAGADWAFLLTPLLDPIYLALMIGTAIAIPLLVWLARKLTLIQRMRDHIKTHAIRYDTLIPWMLRLSLGIMLIGAGVHHSLILPSVPAAGWLGTLEILLGFLLLAGLLTGFAAFGAIALYAYALVQDWYAVGNLDVLAIAFAILVLGNALPGIDDLFGFELFPRWHGLRAYAPTILRIGIGIAFSFLAVYEKLLNPRLSAVVIEKFALDAIIPVSVPMWVLAAGLIELAVGLAILFGLMTRLSVATAFIVLSLSFFFFGEDVASHITIFGTLSVLFVTGGGPWSIDSWWTTRTKKAANL